MSDDEDAGKDLAEYVKLSAVELEILVRSYDEKIKEKEQRHWINSAQKRFSFDVRKLLYRFLFVLLGLLLMVVIVFSISAWINQKALAESALTWFIPFMFLLFPIGLLVQVLDDGTNILYRERDKIALVLKNKHVPKKDALPNLRTIFILKLLAQHSEGLNRSDIITLAQKEFNKSLDPKTIDEYLRQLSYAIKVQEIPYRSQTGSHDMEKTKVYLLK